MQIATTSKPILATIGGIRSTLVRRIATTVEISKNVVALPSGDGGKLFTPIARSITKDTRRIERSRKIVRTKSHIGTWSFVGVVGIANTTSVEIRKSLSAM